MSGKEVGHECELTHILKRPLEGEEHYWTPNRTFCGYPFEEYIPIYWTSTGMVGINEAEKSNCPKCMEIAGVNKHLTI